MAENNTQVVQHVQPFLQQSQSENFTRYQQSGYNIQQRANDLRSEDDQRSALAGAQNVNNSDLERADSFISSRAAALRAVEAHVRNEHAITRAIRARNQRQMAFNQGDGSASGSNDSFEADDQSVKYLFTTLTMTAILTVAILSRPVTQPGLKINIYIVVQAFIMCTDLIVSIGRRNQQQPFSQWQFPLKLVSILLFFFQILWLIHGNVLYYDLDHQQKQEYPFLVFTLLSILTFGYINIVVFILVVVGMLLFFVGKLFRPMKFQTLHPVWLIKQADNGFWSLFEEEEIERTHQHADNFSEAEANLNGNRDFAEKKLVLDQLCDRKYEDVRRETYLDIFYGFKQGTPTAFLGKSFSCMNKTKKVDNSFGDKKEDLDPENRNESIEESNLNECAICQEEFNHEDTIIQMPCHVKHIFHSNCLRPWIKQMNCCPNCREKVQISDQDIEKFMVKQSNRRLNMMISENQVYI